MTRIHNGFWSDITEDDGFFLTDGEIDLVTEWLESYASALERQWVKNGSEGNPKKQKFLKVRSLKARVDIMRNGDGEKTTTRELEKK